MIEVHAVLDSSILAARYFDPLTRAQKDHIDEIVANSVAMSALNLSELLSVFRRERGWTPRRTYSRLVDLGLLNQMITVHPFDTAASVVTAEAHADLKRARVPGSPGLADCACLALARSTGLRVVTTDERWPAFARSLQIEIEFLPLHR